MNYFILNNHAPQGRHQLGQAPLEIVKTLRRSRGIFRRKITLILNQLEDLKQKRSLTISLSENLKKEIQKEFACVKVFDERMNNIMVQNDLESGNENYYSLELEDQINYCLSIEIELDHYVEYNQDVASGSGSAHNDVSSQDLMNLMSQMTVSEGRPPPLNCGIFTGKERDKFAFNTFLNQFNNVIGSRK